MSNNNNKQTHTSFTTVNVGDVDLGIPEINQVTAAPLNLVQSAEASTTTPALNKLDYDVKPQEKNDSLGYLLGRAERGQTRGKQPSPSIYKVSRILRDLSKSSYKPQLVSIGPIHREDKKLQKFEWLKECYLNDLLSRCHDSPKETLDACLHLVNTLIPKIRESYAGVKKNYSDSELARMMVMDGCFILEFCFKHDEEDKYLPNKMQNNRIAMDLMLLENQVPFFVLRALFDCSMGKLSFTLSNVLDDFLAPYIKLFRSPLPEKKSILSQEHDQLREEIPTTYVDLDSTDHVLGYLHRRYQLVAAKSSNNPKHAEASKPVDEERIENTAFHSIVVLERSGVNFKPHQEEEWSIMTFKFQRSLFPNLSEFWSNPTLFMPTLVIDNTTELILRNFIAYEQSLPQDRYCFTSYARAMYMLIHTQEDFAKLVQSKVLVNMLGKNQEAVDMINKICKNVLVKKFCYTKEFKKMDEYYNGYWPKNIAMLRSLRYFNDPFYALALLGGLILYFLTLVQTYYTFKGK